MMCVTLNLTLLQTNNIMRKTFEQTVEYLQCLPLWLSGIGGSIPATATYVSLGKTLRCVNVSEC